MPFTEGLAVERLADERLLTTRRTVTLADVDVLRYDLLRCDRLLHYELLVTLGGGFAITGRGARLLGQFTTPWVVLRLVSASKS